MKLRIFVSLLSLCLATVVMVTGFTMAWFTATDSPPPVIINPGSIGVLTFGEEAGPPELFAVDAEPYEFDETTATDSDSDLADDPEALENEE